MGDNIVHPEETMGTHALTPGSHILEFFILPLDHESHIVVSIILLVDNEQF